MRNPTAVAQLKLPHASRDRDETTLAGEPSSTSKSVLAWTIMEDRCGIHSHDIQNNTFNTKGIGILEGLWVVSWREVKDEWYRQLRDEPGIPRITNSFNRPARSLSQSTVMHYSLFHVEHSLHYHYILAPRPLASSNNTLSFREFLVQISSNCRPTVKREFHSWRPQGSLERSGPQKSL